MLADLRAWLLRHAHPLINAYLFANIIGFVGWQGFSLYRAGRLDFIELAFIAHNLVFAGVVLARREPVAIDRNAWHQLIALVAFFSGIAFMGQPATENTLALQVSRGLMLLFSLFGIATLLNLGKSFGILIACRVIKTGGLYRLVRHPMYATDILLRIAYLVSHCNVLTSVLFLLSTACYVYRAMLEERFLLTQAGDYRAYMAQVRYRFIPGLL